MEENALFLPQDEKLSEKMKSAMPYLPFFLASDSIRKKNFCRGRQGLVHIEKDFKRFAVDGEGYFSQDIRDARKLMEEADIQYMSIGEIFADICLNKQLNSGMLYI